MKIFVSQLMNGRPKDEILKERFDYMVKLKNKYPDAEFVDSYDPTPGNAVYKLGEAIQLLSKADCIAFLPRALTKGRGCLVELLVARLYGIEIIDTY